MPPQKRVVITVPFTPVEEQHYSSLFQQMAEECGLGLDGGPLRNDWDPENQQTIEQMRTWLVRLRQTCLHPEVGSRNRRALGNYKGPLRTVAEVLEVMIDANLTNTRTEERNLLQSRIRRGQILEHAEQSEEALRIWLSTLDMAQEIVHDCRQQLQVELDKLATNVSQAASKSDDEVMARTGPHRNRLRSSIELEHVSTFFVANAYYQLKTKETESDNNQNTEANNHTKEPSSARAKDFQQKEEAYYEKAKVLRRELLTDSRAKADLGIAKFRDPSKSLIHIAAPKPMADPGGIQARPYFERIRILLATFSHQLMQLVEWRSKAANLLALPLVDEEEKDLEGDEYESSTKHQDEVYVYVDALRAIASDCHCVLVGQENLLIDHEMETLFKQAKAGQGHAPQLLLQLLNKRRELKPLQHLGSVRGLITELRELKNNLRGSVERLNSRAAAEIVIVNSLLQHLHSVSQEQTKIILDLEKEVELFKDAMNLRLEYYRQLQAISDTVAPFEEEMSDEAREDILVEKMRAERGLEDRIATLKSKSRYLIHLRDEAQDTRSQRICIICTSPFETGILTTCGHTYCAECLRLWWGHRKYFTIRFALRSHHPRATASWMGAVIPIFRSIESTSFVKTLDHDFEDCPR